MGNNPKLGARMIRAGAVGMLIGSLFYIIYYLAMEVMNGIGGTTVMDPGYMGIFGFLIGLSASLGIEFSKDIDAQ